MPGHKVSCTSKTPALFDKYQCAYCNYLLKDAVQPICGHWLCECCSVQLLAENYPKCPKLDCQEFLKSDKEGAKCFPDRVVRSEIKGMTVGCPHQQKGCQWEGRLARLETHLKACGFLSEECILCGAVLTPDQIGSLGRVCPKALMKCPLVEFGCRHTRIMTQEELKQHVNDHGLEHLQSVADVLKLVRLNHQSVNCLDEVIGQNVSISRCGDIVLKDQIYSDDEDEGRHTCVIVSPQQDTSSHSTKAQRHAEHMKYGNRSDYSELVEMGQVKGSRKVNRELKNSFLVQDKKINSQRSHNTGYEKIAAEVSLVEGYICDGTFKWKIPLLSQIMTGARLGVSFFSLPFYSYSGQHNSYKMCLQLYILGDGSGRGTHMSLFFVIMKGKFDNILKWPFTSKVTFKLINQRGGREISGTFQPDPISSSFQKPTSDMNIASGCSRFMSHTELNEGGFIVDDSVSLQCLVDHSIERL